MNSGDGGYRQLRLRAEALLEQSVDLEEALSHRDVRALIHDLSVHQIELEMQNDELQQAQREMQQVRDEYLKLYNHAPIGYFSLDDQGIIIKHNQTISTMLGNPALVAIGMPLGSFMLPEDREIFQARYKAIFKSPQQKNVELRFCRSDGSLFWVRLSGRRDTCLTDDQEIREVLLLAVADISSEKQAEKAMVDNLRFVSTLLDTVPSPIFYKDARGVYLGCNKAYTSLTGMEQAFLRGKTVFDVAPLESAQKYHEMDLELLQGTGTQVYESQLPISKDECRDVVFYKSTYLDASGQVAGLVGVILDITDRNKAEEELRLTRDAANTANRAKSEFLAGISHEIRTPMNGILGMVQLMELSELTEEQKEYLDILKMSGSNLLTLINNILDLSKIEAEKIELELSEFSPRAWIQNLVMSQQHTIANKGISLRISMAVDVPEVLIGDQLRINQVLLNLLGNAIKFTEKGSITLSVVVLEQNESGVLLDISVQDTGIGIPQEIQEEIFNPFTQANGSITRRYGGTGLGLTISRRLAELMGGKISVESVEGSGSTFHLLMSFPVAKTGMEHLQMMDEQPELWNGPSLRILFVEDNEINTRFGLTLLNKMGHQVMAAENGREALDLLEQHSFDLVLMDVQMPVMNGDEALRLIREKDKLQGTYQPVLALTAYALSEDREKFLQQGFDGYLSKPIEVRALANEMMRVAVI